MVWAVEERIGSRVVVMKVFPEQGMIWVRLISYGTTEAVLASEPSP